MNAVLPKPGRYIVAVSGGVDSVVLLHLLNGQPGLQLVVAHFDHGMRPDSAADRRFVGELAQRYGLAHVFAEGRLGASASEATARTARYKFLRTTQQSNNAQAIITAHHQDDMLETAIINLLRGSGRRGLTALSSRPDVLRPLLDIPKASLLAYAKTHNLAWREDSTNSDETYLRNYVRRRLLSQFDPASRKKFVQLIRNAQTTNQNLDALLVQQLAAQSIPDNLDRAWFNQLPHAVAREVMAAWLRAHDLNGFDRKTLERLVIAAKVGASGKSFPVKARLSMQVRADHLALTEQER